MKKEPPWKRCAAVFAWRSTGTSASIPSSMRPSRTTRRRSISSFNNAKPAMLDFPIDWVRASFPALHTGDKFVFFDNGAGAQVPQIVLDAVHDHLLMRTVQRGGRYRGPHGVYLGLHHG